ncbi:MAG: VOC family protein [Rhodospirillales bacterium]|nr:MAG: VOC family protein [Rhodospirillales bacterium]
MSLFLIVFLSSVAAVSGAANLGQGRVYDIGIYVTDLQRTKEFYTRVFGLRVVREWETTDVSVDDKAYKTVNNPGLYLAGSNGMRLEFLQKGDPGERPEVQQPINHFAIRVEDVQAAFDLAIAMGAKPVFPGTPLQYARIGELKVLNTQIIGLDGERIQILKVLKEFE